MELLSDGSHGFALFLTISRFRVLRFLSVKIGSRPERAALAQCPSTIHLRRKNATVDLGLFTFRSIARLDSPLRWQSTITPLSKSDSSVPRAISLSTGSILAYSVLRPHKSTDVLNYLSSRVPNYFLVDGITIHRGQRSGSPKLLDDRDRRRLGRIVRANRAGTLAQITATFDAGGVRRVSSRSVQHALSYTVYGSRRPTRVPLLIAQHWAQCLTWAREVAKWTLEDWKHVAWSDESRYRLFRTDGSVRVWCKLNEAMNPGCQQGTVQAGGGSVMCGPFMDFSFPDNGGMFQQDDEPSRRATDVRDWFEEHSGEFQRIVWPARFPDMNPIERVWDMVGRAIRTPRSCKPRNIREIWAAIRTSQEVIRPLLESVPLRWLACSPPTLAEPGPIPGLVHSGTFACENRGGRCRWSAGFLWDLPFPLPFHSGAAMLTSLHPHRLSRNRFFRDAQISQLIFASVKSKEIWAALYIEVLISDECECGAVPERNGGGNWKPPRKLADEWHRPTRLPQEINGGITPREIEPEGPTSLHGRARRRIDAGASYQCDAGPEGGGVWRVPRRGRRTVRLMSGGGERAPDPGAAWRGGAAGMRGGEGNRGRDAGRDEAGGGSRPAGGRVQRHDAARTTRERHSVHTRYKAAKHARLPGRTGFNPRPGRPRIFASGNRAGECRWSAGFLGDIPFLTPLHSATAPYSPLFALIGSQDIDVKSRPNLFTHSLFLL
ncbi:hypothetical protein PR048_010442 [Dryococelus australis]|uniref:Uncharacterized protein n=1 Tax=Dryococelus australis TaxID=614101 RepID=A0ABQ9I4Q9_9NEOP|nr:hypothetical protein PR048_010442 [Dryococelus australis]